VIQEPLKAVINCTYGTAKHIFRKTDGLAGKAGNKGYNRNLNPFTLDDIPSSANYDGITQMNLIGWLLKAS